jgi:hypothetical protein
VTIAGTYTVTQTVGTCTSIAGSGVASPGSGPAAPTVIVTDNCDGTSLLTASNFTGTLTVEHRRNDSVDHSDYSRNIYGYSNSRNMYINSGSGVANPGNPPNAPTVIVTDNCDGTSLLTATNFTGALLWSTGETTPSITVTTAGTYTVTQSVELDVHQQQEVE